MTRKRLMGTQKARAGSQGQIQKPVYSVQSRNQNLTGDQAEIPKHQTLL